MWLVGSLYRRVGPNRALIVYGFGGHSIVTAGGRVVWPLFQSPDELSLELMSFDVAPEQELYTAQGVAVTGGAGGQIKGESDPGRHRPGKTEERGVGGGGGSSWWP